MYLHQLVLRGNKWPDADWHIFPTALYDRQGASMLCVRNGSNYRFFRVWQIIFISTLPDWLSKLIARDHMEQHRDVFHNLLATVREERTIWTFWPHSFISILSTRKFQFQGFPFIELKGFRVFATWRWCKSGPCLMERQQKWLHDTPGPLGGSKKKTIQERWRS